MEIVTACKRDRWVHIGLIDGGMGAENTEIVVQCFIKKIEQAEVMIIVTIIVTSNK